VPAFTWYYYIYALEIFSFFWVIFICIKKYRVKALKVENKQQILFFMIGMASFIFMFVGSNLAGQITLLQEISFIGSVGMLLFLFLLGYLIAHYKIFNIKLIIAEARVVVMAVLISSQFLFIQIPTNRILTAVTLCFVTIFGLWLSQSVKVEIKQREQLSVLAHSLEKANLRLKELDQQKTEFLSIAAHQLRTPLSVLKGYISMILEGDYGKVSKGIKEVLENMEKSNGHLVKLIDQFLDVSRIEQGRTKYDFKKSDLIKLIQGVAEELNQRAEDNGLKIIFNPDEVKDANVIMDEEKVRHVIFNFIDNAIKYSENGEIKVLLEYEYDGITIRIKDSGLGFGKVDQANFFQKFYRGENVKGTNVNGTGLGLFVCHKFIEAHHGRIWGHSQGLKKGSEFGFWLPLKQ
jgi:signal transduction histidine kinase